jgi:hypothetical protein
VQRKVAPTTNAAFHGKNRLLDAFPFKFYHIQKQKALSISMTSFHFMGADRLALFE